MRIAVVNAAAHASLTSPGAVLDAYRTLTAWAEALLDAGAAHVRVFQRFEIPARFERRGVEYVFCDDRTWYGRSGPVWTRDLLRQLEEFNPDLVHVNGTAFPREVRAIASVRPRPTVVVQHHGEACPRVGPRRAAVGRGLREADVVLFSTAAHADPWHAAGLIPASTRTRDVMESSTDLVPLDRGEARRRTRLPGAPACLWVGRLTPVKDSLTVLAAFEHALRELPGAQLTFVYQVDDLLPDLRRFVEGRAALQRAVHFIGTVPHGDLAAFYCAADLFVSGSHREGSGYALIEAMACGLPAAVTDIPSFRVLTDDGRLGALWPPGRPGACASAIVSLSGRVTQDLRQQVRAAFETRFTWDAIGRRALRIYEEVVADRSSVLRTRGEPPAGLDEVTRP